MAFALKGAGSATTAWSVTADQASLVVTTATTAGASGDLAVLLYAVDNNQTTDGDEGAVTSVTDSGGNAWRKAVEFTNGQGTAQTGATNGIWYSNLTAAISIGGTVTLNFSNATSRDATAASLTYFTKAAGQDATVEASNTLANDAAAAGSLDATTANIACLRIRAIASESSTATALTKTAAFTAVLTQAISTGGASAGNQGIRGEYLISTATGQASAPTGGAGAVDNASVYVAFKEVPTLAAFARTNSDETGAQVAIKSHKISVNQRITASAGFFLPPSPRTADPALTTGVPVATSGSSSRIRRTYYQSKFEPPPIAEAEAPPATIEIGIPIDMGGAVPTSQTTYYQSKFVPPYVVPATPNGWSSPLSVAPTVASAVYDNQQLPSFKPNIVTADEWQQSLSDPLPLPKPQLGFSSVPFNTLPGVTADEWQPALSGAPKVAKPQQGFASVPLNTAQLSVNYTNLWQQPLSGAPPVAKAQQGAITGPFSPTAAVTADEWQPALSAPLPLPKAREGLSTVPLNPAAVVTAYTDFNWYAPLAGAPAPTKVQPGLSSVPFNTAQSTATYTDFDWYQPLSTPPPVAKAQPGFGFVPFNTAQVTTNYTGWQSDLSTPLPQSPAQQGFVTGPFSPASSVTADEWQPALSTAPTVAKAKLTDWQLPFTVANVVTQWQQPLSTAPKTVPPQQGFSSVPFNTAQTSVNYTSFGWYQPLSTSLPVVKPQQGFTYVPLDTTQIIFNTVTIDKWQSALSTPRYRTPFYQSDFVLPYVAITTPPATPDVIHSIPFLATMGCLLTR